ncbi:MAG: hypothetical protein HY329_02780 [Chloroflexi bacterium]|nr:hypothetical protein [Chloroflexota bacterium]
MELKTYWAIICRRWWLVVGLTLITGVASILLQPSQVLQYRATVRLGAQLPASFEESPQVPRSQGALEATRLFDYLLDDLVEVIKGGGFLTAVQARLTETGQAGAGGSFDARKMRRLLTITTTSGDPTHAALLASAAGDLLSDPGNLFLRALAPPGTTLIVVERPTGAIPVEARSYLNIAIRVILGLLAGLTLAFLLEYFDDTMRSPGEVERALGLPVVGELPRDRSAVKVS